MTVDVAAQQRMREMHRRDDEASAARAREALHQRTDACEAALASDRHSPRAHLDLADCYRNVDRLDLALDVLRTGLERCESTAEIYRAGISVLKDMNRTDEAIDLARRARRAHPADLLFTFREHLLLPILYESSAQ